MSISETTSSLGYSIGSKFLEKLGSEVLLGWIIKPHS